MRWTWWFALGALVVAAAGRPVAGQEPAGTTGFGEEIEVRVVNVEAVVTGRNGDRVHGLSAADFKLLVDGRETPVEYFTEVADGVAAAAQGASAQGAPGVEPGQRLGRSYLVYIDEVFSLASVRDEVLRRLESNLSLLEPPDRMAILAFDGVKTDILSGWTSDRGALAVALEKARRRDAGGIQQVAHQRKLQADVDWILDNKDSLDEGIVAMTLEAMSHRISPEARTQLGKTSAAAAAALRGFEAPPGRRVMMLLTGAWSMSVAGYLYGPLLQAADRLGYTLYPVDLGKSDAEDITSFDILARATGGRAAVSTQLAVFRTVEEDTRSYYWIGFSPSWKGGDRPHQVTLEMRRPDLRVRVRSSVSAPSLSAQAAMKAEGILLFGGEEREHRVMVWLGEPHRVSRTDVEVPVTLAVPVDALLVVPEGAGYVADASLAIAARDEKGRRADLPPLHLRATLAEPPPAGVKARFRTTVRLRDAAQRLVFTVNPPGTGKPVWGEAEVKPAKR